MSTVVKYRIMLDRIKRTIEARNKKNRAKRLRKKLKGKK